MISPHILTIHRHPAHNLLYAWWIFPSIAFEKIIFSTTPFIFVRTGFSGFLKKKIKMKACDSFIRICDSIRVSLHTIVQTTTTNCAQGQGSSLTLPLFDPSWKKSVMIPRDIKLFFCRLPLASTLHPQMTCPRDAKNKGAYNRSTYVQPQGGNSPLTQDIDNNNNSSNTHTSSDDLFHFSTIVRRKRINKIITIFWILENIAEETVL